jgi:hypothetical protein
MRSLFRFSTPGRALAVIVPSLCSCYVMRPLPPSALQATHPPRPIWVTSINRPALLLDSARIIGDTLVGFVNGGGQERLPVANTSIRGRQLAVAKTVAVATATAATTIALLRVANPPNPCTVVMDPAGNGHTVCP